MRVLKFNMPPEGEQRVFLTKSAKPLAVGWQGRQLVCWVETAATDEKADDTEPWRFYVVMTGQDVPDADYLGTAQLIDGLGPDAPYVVHVYGRTP